VTSDKIAVNIDGPNPDLTTKINSGTINEKFLYMQSTSTYPKNQNDRSTKEGDPIADHSSFIQLEDGKFFSIPPHI
jgi:hypothetical protein